MDVLDFFNMVERNEELQGTDIELVCEDPRFAIEHLPTKVVTTVSLSDIELAPADVLEDILTLRQEPNVLYHITRVCGYYSKTENWNQSKLGELVDRHAGNYAVTP